MVEAWREAKTPLQEFAEDLPPLLDRLSPEEQEHFKEREEFLEQLKSKELPSDNPLPDLPGETLVLAWDMEQDDPAENWGAGDTVIRHGTTILWRERCGYEGHDRYCEMLTMLKTRYGSRLHDLVPTDPATGWLYGDDIFSIDKIRNVRAALRAASTNPTDEELPG